jgi:SRSO17 transposase
MTADQIEALAPELTAFLRPFERFFDTPESVRHFRNYSRGLLSDLPRKTAEPLALFAGTPPRNLQQFLKACLWDQNGLADAVQHRLRDAVADLPPDPVGTVAVLDETSALKQGTKTPGVKRQYLGCVGKVANGIVTVHLAVARGSFKALLGGELFLPQSWDADRPRCAAADIPDSIGYRPKWRIGLELLARAEVNGWQFDWLTFDEGYGGKPAFLRKLDGAGLRFVGEVPSNFSCRPGRRRTALSAAAIFAQPGMKQRSARAFRLTQQTGPAAVWQAKAVDVALGDDPRPRYRLIVARNRETSAVKYFLTNAPKRIGMRRVLAAGFVRWNVEHLFRIAKGEFGLTHFEGRSYVSLKRHLALCLVVMAFVALHTQRLRGEKPGGDAGASRPGVGVGVPAVPGPATRDR